MTDDEQRQTVLAEQKKRWTFFAENKLTPCTDLVVYERFVVNATGYQTDAVSKAVYRYLDDQIGIEDLKVIEERQWDELIQTYIDSRNEAGCY